MIAKVSDCTLIHFAQSKFRENEVRFIEYGNNLDFLIKRIYFLYNIDPYTKRGNHAHKNLTQCLIPLKGNIEVILSDGIERKILDLNDPKIGLIIHPYIWKELYFKSREAMCLIIASDTYSEDDYIRSYDDFLLLRNRMK